MSVLTVWSAVAWWMALIPLATLGVLRLRGQSRARIWWIVAAVLGISWLADTVALAVGHPANWAVSFFYPSVQGIVLAFTLLSGPTALRFVGLLVAMGLVSAASHGLVKPEDGLRTAAWIGGGVIAWDSQLPRFLRYTLLATFGLGWFAWFVYTLEPAVASWAVYQMVRAAGIGLFTVGAVRPQDAP